MAKCKRYIRKLLPNVAAVNCTHNLYFRIILWRTRRHRLSLRGSMMKVHSAKHTSLWLFWLGATNKNLVVPADTTRAVIVINSHYDWPGSECVSEQSKWTYLAEALSWQAHLGSSSWRSLWSSVDLTVDMLDGLVVAETCNRQKSNYSLRHHYSCFQLNVTGKKKQENYDKRFHCTWFYSIKRKHKSILLRQTVRAKVQINQTVQDDGWKLNMLIIIIATRMNPYKKFSKILENWAHSKESITTEK